MDMCKALLFFGGYAFAGRFEVCTLHTIPCCQPSNRFIKLEVVCTVKMVLMARNEEVEVKVARWWNLQANSWGGLDFCRPMSSQWPEGCKPGAAGDGGLSELGSPTERGRSIGPCNFYYIFLEGLVFPSPIPEKEGRPIVQRNNFVALINLSN